MRVRAQRALCTRGPAGPRARDDVDNTLASRFLSTPSSAALSQGAVLRLQRVAGNATVTELLRRPQRVAPEEEPVPRSPTVPPAEALQRTCLECAQGDGAEQKECCGPAAKMKGEEVADDQIKTKDDVPVRMTVISSEEEPSPQAIAKAKCPSPVKAPVGFVVSGSTSAQKAAMAACTWGITAPDNLKVSTKTCKDGTDWRLRVTGVTSKVRHFSRLLSGQKEPTTSNATKTTFCDQVGELDKLGTCAGAWYMLSAVKAHEAVHVKEWKTSFPTDWPAVKTTIEGISVPASGTTEKKGAATKDMRASAAFTGALDTSATNFPVFWAIADPNANTDAAERKKVDPRIKAICKHAKSKKWDPGACAVCAAKGIT